MRFATETSSIRPMSGARDGRKTLCGNGSGARFPERVATGIVLFNQ